ncbi:MAG TPA: hypothetical protein VNA22_08515 [Pyrinomonadaceae bacterium]|nr:hypothetical protein [Pyrinomonadaceae bacterium]
MGPPSWNTHPDTIANADGFTDGLPDSVADGFPDSVTDGFPDSVTDGFADSITDSITDGFTDSFEQPVSFACACLLHIGSKTSRGQLRLCC